MAKLDEERIAREFDGVRSGAGWSIRCPGHDDTKRSCSLTFKDDGNFTICCHAGCEQDHTFQSFLTKAGHLLNGHKSRLLASPTQETPEQAATRFAKLFCPKGTLQHLAPYQDASGKTLYCKVRAFDAVSNTKEIRSMHFDGKQWHMKEPTLPPRSKPLYRLPEILARPGEPVWIVEGEMKADLLRKLGVLVTTSGGAKSVANTDWSPLKGRECYPWPDNDDPGRQYMNAVKEVLMPYGCKFHTVDVSRLNLPEKGDCADWLKMNPEATKATLLALVPNIKPVILNPMELRLAPKRKREKVIGPFDTGTINMIFAWRGVGKTQLALALAAAIASGTDFMKWSTPQARKVLYIDAEMNADSMQERLEPLIRLWPGDAVMDNLGILTPDLQPNEFIPDLTTKEGQQWLEAALAPYEVIVLDNISTLFRSGKENEAESWNPVAEWLRSLKAKGKCLIVIHHSNKGGAQRGTSKREDEMATVLQLREVEGLAPTEECVFEVHYSKGRYLKATERQPFEARLDTTGGLALWTYRDLELALIDRVAGLADEGMSQKDIAEELKVSKGHVSRLVKRIKKQQEETKQETDWQDPNEPPF